MRFSVLQRKGPKRAPLVVIKIVIATHPIGVEEIGGARFLFGPQFKFSPMKAIGSDVGSSGSACDQASGRGDGPSCNRNTPTGLGD